MAPSLQLRLIRRMPWLADTRLLKLARRGRNKFRNVVRRLRGMNRPLAHPWNLEELNRFLQPFGHSAPLGGTTPAAKLLDFLLARPDLRRKFPGILFSGPDSPFAAWLKANHPDAASFIQALRKRPAAQVYHLYDQDEHLRDVFPLALTPGGWGGFAGWLLASKPVPEISIVETLWFLLERADDPTQGLEAAYRRTPAWQVAVRDALDRPEAWEQLKSHVAAAHRITEPWLKRAKFPAASEPARVDGVNILGHFNYPSGLQVACRNMLEAYRRAGIPTSVRDVPSSYAYDEVGRDHLLGMHPHPITLTTMAPEPLHEECYGRAGLAMREGTYRIGYWYWELEEAPAAWRSHESWLHEIWAPTRFIGEALRKVMTVPVKVMLPGIPMPEPVAADRARFGLPADKVLFLFVFDMCSLFDRKNPLAVIDAFRTAFSKRDKAALAIKVSRGSHDPDNFRKLKDACDSEGIHLIDAVLPFSDIRCLMASCDAYVSLHRSEGFGLTIAEAMAMGKPAIASGYSGNVDFMTPENSLPVKCERTKIVKTVYPYTAGSTWCEPDTADAARLMRRLYDDPAAARELGERGKRDIQQTLSLEAAGKRMAARLWELRMARQTG